MAPVWKHRHTAAYSYCQQSEGWLHYIQYSFNIYKSDLEGEGLTKMISCFVWSTWVIISQTAQTQLSIYQCFIAISIVSYNHVTFVHSVLWMLLTQVVSVQHPSGFAHCSLKHNICLLTQGKKNINRKKGSETKINMGNALVQCYRGRDRSRDRSNAQVEVSALHQWIQTHTLIFQVIKIHDLTKSLSCLGMF